MLTNNKIKVKNRRNLVTYARVFLPYGLKNRDAYVQGCCNKERISVITNDGEFITEVVIDKGCLQEIEFPEAYPQLGSAVILLTNPTNNQAAVVGVINNGSDSNMLTENSFKMIKSFKSNTVSIVGNSKSGSLMLKVDSQNDSLMSIDVVNNNKDAELKMNVLGKVNINSTDNVTVRTKNKLVVNADKGIELGDSELEPSVLGDTLKTILEEIIDEIKKITVPTAVGTSGIPVNVAQFDVIKNKLNDILSTTNKLK